MINEKLKKNIWTFFLSLAIVLILSLSFYSVFSFSDDNSGLIGTGDLENIAKDNGKLDPEDQEEIPEEKEKPKEKVNLGKISLSDTNLSIEYQGNITSDQDVLVLKSAIKLESGKITVLSELYPELNQKAKLTFKGKNYLNPIMCYNTICDKSMIPTKEKDKTYSYIVEHFSIWEIVDNTWNGTPENMTIYSDGLGLSPDAFIVYNFDTDTGNAEDLSFYGNNGTLWNGVVWNNTGIFGTGSYTFDGLNDKINASCPEQFGKTTNITQLTISMWIQLRNYTTTERFLTKFSGAGSTAGTIIFDTPAGAGSVGKLRFGYANSSNLFQLATTSSAVLVPNSIHHLAVTFNSGDYNIYVNGTNVLSGTFSQEKFIVPYNHPITLGSAHTSTASLNGTMDEVRIWNRSLSQEEVQQIFNNGMKMFAYSENGKYTSEIYNSSDYDPAIYANRWLAQVFNNNTNISGLWGRAGDCPLNTSTYGPGTYNGSHYTFSGTSGKCFQYYATFSSDTNTVLTYQNSTISSFKSKLPKNITFNSPANNSNISINSVLLNITVTDPDGDEMTVWFYGNDSLINKTTNVANGSTAVYNWTGLVEGSYHWNLTAGDATANTSSQTLFFAVDMTAPAISLLSPLNNTGDNDGDVTFNYNVTDFLDLKNCSLILRNGINQTNASITRNINQIFFLGSLAAGNYNWSINCTDSANNLGASETRIFSVISAAEFSGETTDLSQVNISNIPNLIIDQPSSGKINFSESLDLSSSWDINSYVNISFNRIEINSTALPALNHSARLTLYNLTFSDPRILKDGSACSNCSEVAYTSGTFIFDVSSFTVYSADETPTSSSSSGGGGGSSSISSGGAGGGATIAAYQCTKDSDCGSNQYCSENKCYESECSKDSECNIAEGENCYNHKCIKLFDIKILRLDSPIEPEQFFDFTYLIKGMADIDGDVVVQFWLEKDGKVATSGSDTLFLGSFEEKTESANIFLPTETPLGTYDFYVKIDLEGHKTIAHRTIQVGYGVPLILDIGLEKMPKVTSQEEFYFSTILSFNQDAQTVLHLKEKITRGSQIISEKEKDLEIVRTKTLTETVGRLKPGNYKLELVGNYGENKTTRLSQSFTIEATTKDFELYAIPALVGFAVFIIFLVFWLERKKIAAGLIKEERWIHRHKITFCTLGLFMILGILAYYLSSIGIISFSVKDFFVNIFSWVQFNLWPCFQPSHPYFYYLIGSIAGLIFMVILVLAIVFAVKRFRQRSIILLGIMALIVLAGIVGYLFYHRVLTTDVLGAWWNNRWNNIAAWFGNLAEKFAFLVSDLWSRISSNLSIFISHLSPYLSSDNRYFYPVISSIAGLIIVAVLAIMAIRMHLSGRLSEYLSEKIRSWKEKKKIERMKARKALANAAKIAAVKKAKSVKPRWCGQEMIKKLILEHKVRFMIVGILLAGLIALGILFFSGIISWVKISGGINYSFNWLSNLAGQSAAFASNLWTNVLSCLSARLSYLSSVLSPAPNQYFYPTVDIILGLIVLAVLIFASVKWNLSGKISEKISQIVKSRAEKKRIQRAVERADTERLKIRKIVIKTAAAKRIMPIKAKPNSGERIKELILDHKVLLIAFGTIIITIIAFGILFYLGIISSAKIIWAISYLANYLKTAWQSLAPAVIDFVSAAKNFTETNYIYIIIGLAGIIVVLSGYLLRKHLAALFKELSMAVKLFFRRNKLFLRVFFAVIILTALIFGLVQYGILFADRLGSFFSGLGEKISWFWAAATGWASVFWARIGSWIFLTINTSTKWVVQNYLYLSAGFLIAILGIVSYLNRTDLGKKAVRIKNFLLRHKRWFFILLGLLIIVAIISYLFYSGIIAGEQLSGIWGSVKNYLLKITKII